MATQPKSDDNRKYIVGAVVVAAGASLCIGLAYLYSRYTSEKKVPQKDKGVIRQKKKKEKEKEKKNIQQKSSSKETVLAVLAAMTKATKEIILDLGQQEMDVRRSSPSASQDQISAYLSQTYNVAIQAARQKIFDQYQLTEETCQAALLQYSSDPEVQEAMFNQHALEMALDSHGIRPEDPEEVKRQLDSLPAEFTLEKVTEIFTRLMDRMSDAMEQAMKEVNSRQPPPSEEEKEDLIKQSYMDRVDEVKESILQEYDLDEATLDLAIRKYRKDPTFEKTLKKLQDVQQSRFQQLRAPASAVRRS